MTCLWSFHLGRGEADIIDFGWTCGIGASALWFSLLGHGDSLRRTVVAVLALVWTIRLATYLMRDRVLKPGEDPRYHELRLKWGNRAKINFFLLFESQAFLSVLLSLGFIAVANDSTKFGNFADILAIAVWSIAIAGESLADYQLNSFRHDPSNRGKTCDRGLWRYSRHPNYFFEWVHWLTYPLLAGFSLLWPLTLISVVVMYYLLVYVTGVPPSEKRAILSRGDEYLRYQARTNKFVPWRRKQVNL